MARLFNVQQALKDGIPQDQIDKYLAANQDVAPAAAPTTDTGTPPLAAGTAAPTDTSTPQSPLESFLHSGVLPTITSVGGGILGSLAAPGVGTVAGAGAGGAAGELIRRGLLRAMGEDPDASEGGTGDNQGYTGGGVVNDLKGVATEGALDSLFEGVGGLAVKAVGKGASAAAKIAGITPEDFAQRAMKLTPTEFAKASDKQGITQDADKSIYNVLLGDKSQATGQNIFQVPAEQWGQFTQGRKAEIGQAIKDAANVYTQKGVTYNMDDVKQTVLSKVMPQLTFRNTSTLKDGSQQILDTIDSNFKKYGEAYGKKLTPSDLIDLRGSLDDDLNVYKEDGALDMGEIKKQTANALRNKIADDMPEVAQQNKLYSAYSDVEGKFAKNLKPSGTLGNSFGSAIQSLPAQAAASAISPHVGALAYLTHFVGAQAVKEPNFAGKAANILFKIKNLGADAPPIAQKFYNALQPAVVQTLTAGHRGTPAGSTDVANQTPGAAATTPGNPLAAQLLPSGDEAGMNNLPEGQFKTASDVQNEDGSPNVQGMGLTKNDILMAMLADPKHSALYTSMYNIVKDQSGSGSMTANQQSAMSKVDAAYSVLNRAEDGFGRIAGIAANNNIMGAGGNAALLANAMTGGNANPDVAAYETLRQGTLPILARVIGGDVGNLNEQEQMRAKFLPEVTDSIESAKKKFALLQYMLDTRKKAAMSDPTGGITSSPASSTTNASGTLDDTSF